MSGSHYAPEPGRDDRYDCRTAEQRHEDAAQLALRIDNLVDAVEAMGRERASQAAAITELRSQLAALTSAAMTDLGRESHRITAQEGEIAVLLEPGKPPRRCNVCAVRLDSAEGARAKLAAGKAAWVAEGDVTAVTGAGVE